MTSEFRCRISCFLVAPAFLKQSDLSSDYSICRVPTRTGKPGKVGRHFPVREKSGNFDQTGKVSENHTKYWKIEGISDKYMLFFSDC